MKQYIQVTTTTPEKEDAEKIAKTVLEHRLAACVQIFPCTSMYWWQGDRESAREYICVMKSRSDLFDALEALLTRIHPYEVPEIIARPITAVSPAYEAWLEEELTRSSVA